MDSLGARMKEYEEASRVTLPARLPIILRLDGKAFHTYTKGLKDRPFNRKMMHVMETTAMEICRNVQGAELAYIQSDEISILIHGYKTFESQAWFVRQVQKMVSVAASIAGATFTMNSWKLWQEDDIAGNAMGYMDPAYFDCRSFVLPESEVCNYFIWRQQDAIRNSVQGLAHSLFSHAECQGKDVVNLKAMCQCIGKPWEGLTPSMRHGRVVQRVVVESNGVVRSHWETDTNTPVFQNDRSYIEHHLKKDEG